MNDENDSEIEKQLAELQVQHKFPSFFRISIILALLVAGIFLLAPIATKHFSSWSIGPVTAHHKFVEQQCSACHGALFQKISNEKCIACHAVSDHAPIFSPAALPQHKDLQINCVACHTEHKGEGALMVRNSALCTNCHADIKKILPESQLQNVSGFDSHPEFSKITKNLPEKLNLKLNHALHLAPIDSPKGTMQLGCRDCHEPSDDLRTIKPINFIKHCQSCHALDFDSRFPDRQVPHGDTDVVYKYLYAEYAKLAFGVDKSAQQKKEQKMGVGFVERESRNAETQLFTKTACLMCHTIERRSITLEKANAAQASMFEVVKPEIPARRLPHAIFNEPAHEGLKCEECHHNAHQSTRTEEVLLPHISDCKTCHSENGGHATVKSDCVMCHSYHGQIAIVTERKRSIKEIVKAIGD